MAISLHSFCKENGLPKSSVHRRCQELSIDTSKGLSNADCHQLLVEFGKVAIASEPPMDVTTSYGGAIVPVVANASTAVVSTDLVVRRIQPQVAGYDVTELQIAAQLNRETFEFNLNAMGAQIVEQARQIGTLHGAQAKHAYAHAVASEMSSIGVPTQQKPDYSIPLQ